MDMGTRIRSRPGLAVMASAAVLLAGCGSYGGASASVAPPTSAPAASAPAASAPPAGEAYEVATANDAALGAILVGEDGRTLYIFTKDAGGKSVCNGDCATAWPPFVLEGGETVTAGAGVSGKLATIARDDGAMQVTYDGAPLYYFAADTAAGDVKGQGVKGVWFVATPSGSSSGSVSGGDDYSRGGASPSQSAGPATGEDSATIADFSFSPAALTVTAGTTVTWTNTGSAPHTVTADDGSFASDSLSKGKTFSQAFPTAGTFTYHCSIHRQMTASVVVTP